MSPFAGMTWEECIKKNQDKGDPEAYCGKIKHQVEDAIPNCVFARMDCLEKKYPKMFTIAEKLTLAHDFCSFNSTQEDFGNGSLFKYVEDLLGRKKLKEVAVYKKIKEAWETIRTIGAPTLYDRETGTIYEGQLYLKDIKFDFDVNDAKPYYGTKIGTGETSVEKALKKSQEAYEVRKQGGMGNRPWTPVMSSTVMGYSIKDSNLYLRFHSSPNNAYKYPLGSNEEAHTAANEMTEGSPGRFVWKFFRGHEKGEPTGIENVPEKYGRVAGRPDRMTIGGIGSEGYQQHPYEKLSRAIEGIEEVPQFEKLAKQMRQFKMGVKGEEVPEEEREKGELEAGGTSGAPFRPGEIEKYQKKIYEEKVKRKGIHEEVKGEIEKLRKKRLKRDFDEKEKIYTRYLDNEEQLKDLKYFRSYEPYSKIVDIIEGELIGFNDDKIDEKMEKAENGDNEAKEWILETYIDKYPDIRFTYNKIEMKKNEETGKYEPSLIAKGVNADSGKSSIPISIVGRYNIRIKFTGESFGDNIYGDGEVINLEKVLQIEKKDKTGNWIDISHEYKSLINKKLNEKRKGKGWWGEPERHSKARKEGRADFECKGRWITIKGKHICIEKGKKLQFGSGGRYKVVSGKEYKEKKEERIQKKIEKTGYERERAEQSVEKKREKRKKEVGYKKEPKPVSKEVQHKIKRKQEAIQTRTNKLRELSKGKSWGTIINELLVFANNIVKEAYSKKGAGGLISFAKYIDKIRKDKRISNEKRSKLISQINKLRSEISELQPKSTNDTISELREWVEKNIRLREGWTVENVMWAIVNSRKNKESWKETWSRIGSIFDEQRKERKEQTKKDFAIFEEIIELEKELEKYDFHLEDHFEEFDSWITKNKRHIWIENYYSVEELNEILRPYGIETSPWFKVDKSVKLKNTPFGSWQFSILAKAMDKLPLGIKNMIKEVRIYNEGVGTDPHFIGRSNSVPEAYKKVGYNRSWKEIGGVYCPDKNIAILGGDSKTSGQTLRHEIGHAVWYNLTEKDKTDFKRIFYDLVNYSKEKVIQLSSGGWVIESQYVNLIKLKRSEYQANDVKEFFAESFANYYRARSYKLRQEQGFKEVSKFFRERMKKYE